MIDKRRQDRVCGHVVRWFLGSVTAIIRCHGKLNYDTRQGGYVVGVTKEQLQGAPMFGRDEVPAWGDRAYEQRIHDYYKTAPYWGVQWGS